MRLSVWLAVAVTLTALDRAVSLSCAPCEPALCKPHKPCKYGPVQDTCSCCTQCGKAPGQRCGGPWDAAGRCGTDLFCKKRPRHRHPYAEFNAAGRCARLAAARPLPRDDDVVFPEAEHVQQDEMERAERRQPGARSLIRRMSATQSDPADVSHAV